MQMSPGGVTALLKKFEGCKLTAYRCPANVCTIGYGHTTAAGAPSVSDGMKITQQQADDILSRDLQQYEAAVTMMGHQPLTQHQFDAREDDWGFTQLLELAEVADPAKGWVVDDVLTLEALILPFSEAPLRRGAYTTLSWTGEAATTLSV